MQVAGQTATAMTRQSGTSEVSVKIETKIVKNKKNEVIGVIFLQSCKIKMCLSYRKNLKRSQWCKFTPAVSHCISPATGTSDTVKGKQEEERG